MRWVSTQLRPVTSLHSPDRQLFCSILFLRQNPALTGGDSERGLQIPIKVFYWISSFQHCEGSSGECGSTGVTNQYNKYLYFLNY